MAGQQERVQGQNPGTHPAPYDDMPRENVPKGRNFDSSHDATKGSANSK